MLVFSTQLCELLPSNLLSGSILPPPQPPSLCQSTVCGGCWVLLETIFCRSLTLCMWPDSEPIKLLDHLKQKPRRGGGLTQIKICRKVPFQETFFRWRHFTIDFYEFYLSTVHPFFYLFMCTVWNKLTLAVIISIYYSFSAFSFHFKLNFSSSKAISSLFYASSFTSSRP